MPATDPNLLMADASCFSCLGMSQFEAMQIALLDQISQNIAPPVETFNRISQVGDTRISNVGDNRIYQ